jgi:hypothetical protein
MCFIILHPIFRPSIRRNLKGRQAAAHGQLEQRIKPVAKNKKYQK